MKLFERKLWCVVVFLFLAHPVFAQHEGHRPPPAKPTPGETCTCATRPGEASVCETSRYSISGTEFEANPWTSRSARLWFAPKEPAPARRRSRAVGHHRTSSVVSHRRLHVRRSREIWNTEKHSLAVGSDVTFYSKPSILDSIYGTNPVSWKIFFRLRPQKMSMSGLHGTH